MSKMGRNHRCGCGSGLKFKKCCGRPLTFRRLDDSDPAVHALKERIASQKAHKLKEQGRGRSIISTKSGGNRVVAVGNRVMVGTWKTFPEFLWDYLKSTLGEPWRLSEAAKPPDTRHPILKIFESAAKHVNKNIHERGKVTAIAPSGDLATLVDLSYSLYLLEHNTGVQSELLRRLKRADSFFDALHEVRTAGLLIYDGYDLQFEDETDSSIGHCELVATCTQSGKKFSVECKRRKPGKINSDIGNQLHAALKKPSIHERLIFIELSAPTAVDSTDIAPTAEEAISSIESRESKLTIKGVPAPPAYIVITNNPYHAGSQEILPWTACYAFKMPEFNGNFRTLREQFRIRNRHRAFVDLVEAIKTRPSTPTLFDDTFPGFTEEEDKQRLVIGTEYNLPQEGKSNIFGTLLKVLVTKGSLVATCIFKLADGRNIMGQIPLTEKELDAYELYGDAFFGMEDSNKKFENPIDLFEWLLGIYGNSTKEQLLKSLGESAPAAELQHLEVQELREIICEQYAVQMLNLQNSKS